MDFFLLRTLAAEWDARFVGAALDAAWTQSPRELSLALALPDGETRTLRFRCEAALPLAFSAEGTGRQRRNTADVFEGLEGRTLRGVRTADRDRHLYLDLDDGSALDVALFGSRPNVLWLDAEGESEASGVREAFLRASEWAGAPAPAPRSAPDPRTAEAFRERWTGTGRGLGRAVRQAAPLLPPALADDACRLAGLDSSADPRPLAPEALGRLAEAYVRVRDGLDASGEASGPVVCWDGDRPEAVLPLAPARPPEHWRVEAFATADDALRAYARRALGQQRFLSIFRPLDAALSAAHARRARSAEAMVEELSRPSRADAYEAHAHLLMALASHEGPGHEALTLPDVLAGGEPVTVPLDPALSAVANAERYYARARQARRARAEAEKRWEGVQADADEAARLLARLRACARPDEVETFRTEERGPLARLARRDALGEASEPFRRFPLPGGFEALVGKHAKGNAELTTRHARPHDLWLHARGVPGSHVVVRRPGRTVTVPREAVLAAAALAAYYSEARTQPLAPVQVAERKHVRPVKGGAPGLVRVDREEVVLVQPARPGQP